MCCEPQKDKTVINFILLLFTRSILFPCYHAYPEATVRPVIGYKSSTGTHFTLDLLTHNSTVRPPIFFPCGFSNNSGR